MSEYPHDFVIEKETEVSDGAGGKMKDWNTFKDAVGHVQPLSGETFFKAQQLESKVNYKVFMDYDEEILMEHKTQKLRVFHNQNPFNIDSIIDQGGLGEIMVLMCNGK